MKTELNSELKKVKARIKFLRAASYGGLIPKDVLSELTKLEKKKEFLLSELKR